LRRRIAALEKGIDTPYAPTDTVENKGRAVAELVLREDSLGQVARILQAALGFVTDALTGQPEEAADADDEQQDHDEGAA
jgi:hypothetical protein